MYVCIVNFVLKKDISMHQSSIFLSSVYSEYHNNNMISYKIGHFGYVDHRIKVVATLDDSQTPLLPCNIHKPSNMHAH